MTREVVVYPDRRLKSPAVAIRKVGPAAARLASDLERTARAYPRTVGLAAPQIGAMWRMIFVDCAGHTQAPDPRSPRILINPVVTAGQGSEVGREGCLSLPEITANVRRATAIEIEALGLDGARVRLALEGFEARVVLHEIDHLNGVLILDRVASLATDVFPRKIRAGSGSLRAGG
jgi:peptide deformylase